MAGQTTSNETIVVGGGLLGLTTAMQLSLAGEQVRLLEQDDIASGASHANGGMLTPSMPNPWNGPGVYKQLIASFFDSKSAMKLRLRAIPSLTFWGLKFLRNSTRDKYERATLANWTLADYSLQRMQSFRDRFSPGYESATNGTMKVFRTNQAMENSINAMAVLRDCDFERQILDVSETVAREPALTASSDSIVGAIAFPGDESGDAQLFCRFLAGLLPEQGGAVETGITAQAIEIKDGKVSGVRTTRGLLPAKRVVIAAGNDSASLLARAAIGISVRPAKGYSLTFDCDGLSGLPKIPVIDDALHAAVVPIGNRLRIAGTAEFAGVDTRIKQSRVDNLFDLLAHLYPDIAQQVNPAAGKAWAGLRPMSADGVPYIGATRITNLFVNAGHAHLGWTMAMGSACLLTDLILGDKPGIDPAPYAVAR